MFSAIKSLFLKTFKKENLVVKEIAKFICSCFTEEELDYLSLKRGNQVITFEEQINFVFKNHVLQPERFDYPVRKHIVSIINSHKYVFKLKEENICISKIFLKLFEKVFYIEL